MQYELSHSGSTHNTLKISLPILMSVLCQLSSVFNGKYSNDTATFFLFFVFNLPWTEEKAKKEAEEKARLAEEEKQKEMEAKGQAEEGAAGKSEKKTSGEGKNPVTGTRTNKSDHPRGKNSKAEKSSGEKQQNGEEKDATGGLGG